MGPLATRRATLITECHGIIDKIKAAGREPSDSEQAVLSKNIAAVKEIDAQLAEIKQGHGALEALSRIDGHGDGTTRYLDFRRESMKALASSAVTKMALGGGGVKAMSTATLLPPELNASIMSLGKVPTTLFDALPSVRHSGPNYSFLQQTARVMAAAPVAPHAAKPVSTVDLAVVTRSLQVVATLSSALDSYLLSDSKLVSDFIAAELQYALLTAAEAELLFGSGVSPHLSGILTVAGHLTQPVVMNAAVPDRIGTLRTAITTMELVGQTPGLFITGPLDWENIELTRDADGKFILDTGPVNRAAQTIWGLPVLVCNSVPLGSAALLDLSSVAIDTDGAVTVLANPWSGFSNNEVTVRCEGRFNSSVYQPAGVCTISLAAA